MTQDLTVNGTNQNFNEYSGTANVQQAPGDPRPAFTLSQGPPSFKYQLLADGSSPFLGTNYSARNADWYDPNSRLPYIMNWSAGFQYEFLHNWLAEISYQGNAGVGLSNSWNINQIPLNISTNTTLLNQIFTATQNFKPYPQFGAVNLYSNFGHSTYHAATVRVEKRYATGLTLLGLYTYAKAIDESDGDGGASGVDYYNRSLEKGVAGFSFTHHLQTTLAYELPLGKGRRFMNRGGILNQILGNWEVTTNWLVISGDPATVTYTGSPNRYLPQGSSRPTALSPDYKTPDWNIGPNRFPTTAQNPYLKFSAFAYPAAFTVGAMGRNTYTGPANNWMQLGLSKTFVIRERFRLMLRAEGNNFPFKHPQLMNANSAYNANSPATFGTFTSLRNPFRRTGSVAATRFTGRPRPVLRGAICLS